MTFTDLKEKHSERILGLVVTDIVLQGLSAVREGKQESSALAEACRAAFEDIDAGSWDEIRAVIKRTL
jgi:hypothetical protein